MKKLIILTGMLAALSFATFAEQRGIYMEMNSKNKPHAYTQVNRAPMHISLDVVYDTDAKCITVTGDESMNAEVFLYNESGEIEDYSSSLNAKLLVTTQGRHRIQIEGENWVAEGVIEI